jgi:cell division protein FtsI/penicillin-binding protein 2
MPLRDDLELMRSRISILSYGVAAILGVLVFGFWQLQLVAVVALLGSCREESNQGNPPRRTPRQDLRSQPQDPRRQPPFVQHCLCARETVRILLPRPSNLLANGLGMSADELTQKINRKRKDPPYQPITLKEDAGTGDVAYVMAHAYEMPEVSVEYQPRRLYREGQVAAHALGYIGEVSKHNSGIFRN